MIDLIQGRLESYNALNPVAEGHALKEIDWVTSALHEKIAAINWPEAARDVERFLNSAEKHSLKLWSEKFFKSKIALLV